VITPLFDVIQTLLGLYRWVVIIAAIFTSLASFGVLDTRNRIVWSIGDALYRATEPTLRRIRAVLPQFGTLDLSPLVLILLIWLAQRELEALHMVLLTGDPSWLLR
jgi:YggT family protein